MSGRTASLLYEVLIVVPSDREAILRDSTGSNRKTLMDEGMTSAFPSDPGHSRRNGCQEMTREEKLGSSELSQGHVNDFRELSSSIHWISQPLSREL